MSAVGFSTGAISHGDFARALRLLEPTRARAVELSALRTTELPGLLRELPGRLHDLRARYDYVSLHAPTDFDDEEAVASALVPVADLGVNVVVHPDTLADLRPWRRLGARLCLENMDSRKRTGRSADELAPFLAALPEAGLCFDIAHARQFDATMTEALRILEAFGDRLAQIHISEVNSRGRHFAMSFAAKRAYEPFAEILSAVPVIIESVVEEGGIAGEIDAAERLLRFRGPEGPRGGARPWVVTAAEDAAE